MKLYMAPMEGVTGYIYRRAHRDFFPGLDRYYTPFIVPNQRRVFRARELRDVLPENNAGLPLVPQILTNRAEDFIATARQLGELGYGQVNLNLGCPSGTVVSKGRGAGFLSDPDGLDAFFDAVFSALSLSVSVKTRIGRFSADALPELMEIFNRYPLCELIVHPRTQTQQYRGKPDLQAFAYALANSRNPVCYNGDLFSPADLASLQTQFPALQSVMLGRGLIADPQLAEKYVRGTAEDTPRLRAFHNRLLGDFSALGFGQRNVLFRMKELWSFMIRCFPDSGREFKAIVKSQSLADYNSAVDALFSKCQPTGSFSTQEE